LLLAFVACSGFSVRRMFFLQRWYRRLSLRHALKASARRVLAPRPWREGERSEAITCTKECRGDRPVAPTSAAIAVLPVRCTQTGSQ
jgi:hypothetical protein